MYHLGRLGGIAIEVFDNDTLLENLRGILTVFLDPFGTPHACNHPGLYLLDTLGSALSIFIENDVKPSGHDPNPET